MRSRYLLFVIFTGFLLSGILYYPLHNQLPTYYLSEWPAANQPLSILLVILGGLLVFFSGWFMPRLFPTQAWWHRVLLGGVTGSTLTLFAYALSGSAAGAVLGMDEIFTHGLRLMESKTIFTGLIAQTTIKTISYTFIMLWGMLLSGYALGALGGLFAKNSKANIPNLQVLVQLVSVYLVANAFIFIITLVVVSLLPESIQNAANTGEVTLLFPATSAVWWPLGTSALFYLSSLAASYEIIRYKARQDPERTDWMNNFLFAAVSIGLPLILLALNRSMFFHPITLLFILLSLIGGVRLALFGWQTRKTGKTLEKSSSSVMLKNHFFALSLGMATSFLFALLPLVPMSLNLVLGPVTIIPALYQENATATTIPSSLVDVLEKIYAFQRISSLAVLIYLTIATFISIGFTIMLSKIFSKKEKTIE